jgi:2-polyprenyl-6-methoxyphenol hydroxylase-like FAD-dependent oxidoreductase
VKIAVNGAGIAGPTLAYWLWRYGHEPIMIEKSPRLRTGCYVIDFWGEGYTKAERMGLTDAASSAGYNVEEVRLVDRHGRKVGGFATEAFRRTTNDRFISLPRGDLAAMIYRCIEGHVETVFADSISGIEHHESNVHVTFERGRPRPFDLVVGADGIHSPVRGLVFGPEVKLEKNLGYMVAVFAADRYRPHDERVCVAYTTPDLAEGDDVHREQLRIAYEPYRTLLGHFR